MRILITAARAPIALDLIRHLTRAGHEVLLTDSRRYPLSRFSHLPKGYFRTCAPGIDPARYRHELRRIAIRHSVDLILPTFEEVMHISDGLSEFAGICDVFCDDFHKLHNIHNKFSFIETARNAGMSVPETRMLTSRESVQELRDRSEQFAFKPVYSRFGDQVVLAPSRDELDKVKPTENCPWVAQQFIDGDLYCSFGVAHNGRLRLHSAYRPTCFAGRAGILFDSVQEPQLLRQVQNLVAHLNFTGFISFDFMRDRNGHFHAIECNPRTTSGSHLLNVTNEPEGSDGLTSLARAILEPDGPLIQAAEGQTRMLGFAMAIYMWSKKNHPYGSSKVFRSLRSAQDVIFRWSDPLPALMAPVMLAETFASSLSYGIPLTRSGTYDHEWNNVQPTVPIPHFPSTVRHAPETLKVG